MKFEILVVFVGVAVGIVEDILVDTVGDIPVEVGIEAVVDKQVVDLAEVERTEVVVVDIVVVVGIVGIEVVAVVDIVDRAVEEEVLHLSSQQELLDIGEGRHMDLFRTLTSYKNEKKVIFLWSQLR